ncbi:MAG: hypothetical protein ACERKN_11495 [Velocimicrobium sp.]
MKDLTNQSDKLRKVTLAMYRYPLTTVFLLTATIIGATSIAQAKDYEKLLLCCAVGAFLAALLQVVYERFWNKRVVCFFLMGGGLLLTFGYYLLISVVPTLRFDVRIRSYILLGVLAISFLWIPVIQNRISFNESFMIAFKAFFHAIFYAVIIFSGCSLIIMAIDSLIVPVNAKAYLHIANLVFVLFAPLFFLSRIPAYPGKDGDGINLEKNDKKDKEIERAASCPKFLEVLISYILIPIESGFSVILLLYIIRSISGDFWTNNRMEPMLISYAISIIFLYILSSRINNKFSVFFRLIFPKILICIVILQITSSVIQAYKFGIIYSRYFAILFGIFAILSGLVMSIAPVQKNNLIAIMLIVVSLVSILPPIDAFTISQYSQKTRLKLVLEQNGMLNDNTIIPNESIEEADKEKIISSVEYLTRMDCTNQIVWMPENFKRYDDFYNTFGFNESDLSQKNDWSNVFLKDSLPIDIAGYDILVHTYSNNMESKICDIHKGKNTYTLKNQTKENMRLIILVDESNQELIRFNLNDIFSKYQKFSNEKTELSMDEASFSIENEEAKLMIVVQNATSNRMGDDSDYYMDCYILVHIE